MCREVWSAVALSSAPEGAHVESRILACPDRTHVLAVLAVLAVLVVLVVLDGRNHPFTVLPGPDVLRMAIPQYCLDDPALARVIDEAAADLFLRELGDRTVAQCLPTPLRELPVVGPEATVLEVAALMARSRSPLVVVASPGAPMLGVITLDALLDRVLAA